MGDSKSHVFTPLNKFVCLICTGCAWSRVGWRYVGYMVTPDEAQFKKTQREKLGFNLKIQKAKQPVIGSYLDLSPKW